MVLKMGLRLGSALFLSSHFLLVLLFAPFPFWERGELWCQPESEFVLPSHTGLGQGTVLHQ